MGMKMRKLLLVDDDSLILEDICNLIPWESCGFFQPHTAESGKQALEVLSKEPFDFVITDISMPEMSGVELIRQAKKNFPNVLFAVLSNYDDFVFVKEAMKAGAVEYLLKYEIEPENLKAFLRQMKGRLEEEKKVQKDYQNMIEMHENAKSDLTAHFFRQIYWGQGESRLDEQAKRLGIPLKGGVWIPVLADFPGKQSHPGENFIKQAAQETEHILSGGIRIYGALLKENLALFSFFIPEVSFLLVTALLTKGLGILQERFACSDNKVFLYAGKICMRLEELTGKLREMQDCQHLRFYLGSAVIQMEAGEALKGAFPVREWEQALEEADAGGPSGFEKEWKLFEKAVKEARPPEEQLKERILDALGKRIEKKEGREFREVLQNQDTCGELLRYTKELLQEYSSANQVLSRISRREIKETVQFLYLHYAEAITLNLLADMANMSRAYFCKVFKDETGMSYTDFLNQIRIERAKQYLQRSNLNTGEIAMQTGFGDYRYFCRLFKSLVGKTCGEYRRECAGVKEEREEGRNAEN